MSATLQLSVTAVEGSADVQRNTSQVLVELHITTNLGTYNQSGDTSGSLTLNGTVIADLTGKAVYLNTTTQLYRGVHTVQHAPDGTLTATVKAAFDVNTAVRWIYAEQAAVLPRIHRPSAITVPPLTLGSESELTLTRAVETFTHTVTYALGGRRGTVAERTAETVLRWTPPLELAYELPDSAMGEGSMTVTTYTESGETVGEQAYPFTVYVPQSLAPQVSLAVTLENSGAAESWGVAVKGKTRLGFAASVENCYGAAVRECAFTFAGQTVKGAEGVTEVITRAGCFTPHITVTDSRGRTASAQAQAVEVYDYALPAIVSSSAFRCRSDGTGDDMGAFVSVRCQAVCSDIGGRNALTVRVRSRRADGTWSGYTTLENGAERILSGFAADASYEVELSVVDSLGGDKAVVYDIATERAAFHLGDGGRSGAFGKFAEKTDTLECAWDAQFYGNAAVDGTLSVGGALQVEGTLRVGGKALLDMVYPVGSIYLAYNHTSPATLFGGSWERLAGHFLLAAEDGESIGETGGEREHTLTLNEIPNHDHTYGAAAWAVKSFTSRWGGSDGSTGAFVNEAQQLYARGGGAAHNNMPPYVKVSMWRRTA